MAPSIAYTRASALTPSSNPAVLRCLNSSGPKRHRVESVRSLWWWSRHGTWSSANDENVEERIQRHQKIMRQRFSRALRRRAMWDREDNVSSWMWRSPDGRQGRKVGVCRTMSSTDPSKARLGDKHEGLSSPQEFWSKTQKDFEKFDKDFESFKAAIDRAIEKDPYSALFGRRLQSPPSENNSSWISWLFNRGDHRNPPFMNSAELPNKRKIPIEVLDKHPNDVQPQKASGQTVEATSKAPSEPAVNTQYIYDPVSGRKVPQIPQSNDVAQPAQNFLETLFSEHGASPDKVVKPSKVYGHDPAKSSESNTIQDTKAKSSPKLKGFESSRKLQYQQLRAATLGTSIDTTAVFGGKYEEVSTAPISDRTSTRNVCDPEEDTPPFSGTTYASRTENIQKESAKKASRWLETEGFAEPATITPTSIDKISTSKQRLEPSFDRITRGEHPNQERSLHSKLQPAIDRIQAPRQKNGSLTVRQAMNIASVDKHASDKKSIVSIPNKKPETDKREDLDLLRASDVRAATKATRVTKQEAAEAKVESRNRLELDFETMQNKRPEEVILDAKQLRADSNKLSENINSSRKYAQQNPDAIAAKSMQSTNVVGEKYTDYEKPYNPARANLLEKLKFDSDALHKVPSIYKDHSPDSKVVNTGPMPDVLHKVKAQRDLTEALRLSSIQADEAKKKDDTQIEQLADGIRQVYESEHGPIDLSLAQNSTSKVEDMKTNVPKKPEVDGAVSDSNKFLAEQDEFFSELNHLFNDVIWIKENTLNLETHIRNMTLTDKEATSSYNQLMQEAQMYTKIAESLHKQYDEVVRPKIPHPLHTATVKPGVPQYPWIERHTKFFEPRFIQLLADVKSVRRNVQEVSTSLHDFKRSRVGQSVLPETLTPISTKAAPGSASKVESEQQVPSSSKPSPYSILVYNKVTGEVDQTSMDRLPFSLHEKVEKTNPIRIMGNLNYPAAFVKHFVELEKTGYELTSGGGDMLIFQRKVDRTVATENQVDEPVLPASKVLRNTIAVEEASAQPEISETIAQPKVGATKQAATVLEEIPTEVPQPGPAAPTAPPAKPFKRLQNQGPKIRRQEQVFSGTLPLRTPQSQSQSQQSGRTKSPKSNNTSSTSSSYENPAAEEPSVFARTTRTIRRGVLGVAAFSVAAYTIGVVSEGIGAQAQVEGDTVVGPRTKVVMPVGQRPGIFSTESSRD